MQITTETKLIHDRKIAIIGGGPGGLTLAKLLQMRGANVTVYERDLNKDARVQGAIVDLHYDSGLKVIAAAGLMDAFKANYMPGADKFRMMDSDGNICFDEPTETGTPGFGDERFRPEIDRGALRRILLDVLTPGTVIWDRQLASMEQMNDGWELKFKNGTTAVADIVIGADGYRSKVRPYVTDITALYSGATIIQGEIEHPERDCPEMSALISKANMIAMGLGKTIAAQPRGDGGLTFYAASLYPERWVENGGVDFGENEAVRAFLKNYYKDWNPIFFTLFDACMQFVPRPLNYFPLNQQWAPKANVTLIGDAAHLMPPSGEGVNTAMLDALDLCDCLTNGRYNDVQTAIGAYEEKMLGRAAVLGKEALDGIGGFASPTEEDIAAFKKLLTPDKQE